MEIKYIFFLFCTALLWPLTESIVFDPDDEVLQLSDTALNNDKSRNSSSAHSKKLNSGIYNAYLAQTATTGTIIDLNFADDFDMFDPRNTSGKSRFQFTSYNVIADFDGDTPRMLDNFAIQREPNLVKLSAIPFRHWLPQTEDLDAVLAAYEAAVAPKDAVMPLGPEQTLSVQLKFNCRCVNTQLHKFPADAVTDADDDMRLASCNMALSNSNTRDENSTVRSSGLEFGIAATNKGIWATYNRVRWVRTLDNATYATFEVRRRLANRAKLSDIIIDARIEIDRAVGQTRYYVDNKLLWSVGQWGVLSDEFLADGKNRLVSYSPSRSTEEEGAVIIKPTSFFLYIANTHIMDVGDALQPNGAAAASLRPLVKYADPPGYYMDDEQFVDEQSSNTSSIFGQGAEIGLERLVIMRLPSSSGSTSNQNNNYHRISLDEL